MHEEEPVDSEVEIVEIWGKREKPCSEVEACNKSRNTKPFLTVGTAKAGRPKKQACADERTVTKAQDSAKHHQIK